VIADAA